MAAKTFAEERYSKSVFRNYLLLYMIILQNFHGFIDTNLPMMNNILLDKLEQNFSASIPLTPIIILQVLISSLFYNPHI